METKKFCPKCKTLSVVIKNGKRNGMQCYKCKFCGRQFIDERKEIYNKEIRFIAVKLFYLKLPLRTIASLLGIKSHNNISYWDKNSKMIKYDDKCKVIKIIEKLKEQVNIYMKQADILYEIKSLSHLENDLKSKLENFDTYHFNNILDNVQDMENSEIEQLKNKIDQLENEKNDINTQCRIARLYDRLRLLESQTKSYKYSGQEIYQPSIQSLKDRIRITQRKISELKTKYEYSNTKFDHMDFGNVLEKLNMLLDSLN